MKKNETKATKASEARRPAVLRFSPTAWAKLLFLRDAGDTEIGGFGITPTDDLLFVEDLQLVKQSCTWATAEFDDESVADFFDEQVDGGRRPEQFARIFLHTHPGSSAQPSSTDETTFARVFGPADWAVLFILARGGQCYARLRYNVGPGAEIDLPVDVDYGRPFDASDFELWLEEYLANVRVPPPEPPRKSCADEAFAGAAADEPYLDDWWRHAWSDYADFDRHPEEDEYGYIRDF